MQITTHVRRRDFVIFRLSSLVCPGFFFWLNVAVSLYVVWILFQGVELTAIGSIWAVVALVVVWLLLLCLNVVVAMLESLLIPSLKRGVLGEHRFSLTDEGLLEETSFNRTLHSWDSVEGIRKLFGALMLRAGAGWHIFPRTAFDDPAAREAFLQSIASFRKSVP